MRDEVNNETWSKSKLVRAGNWTSGGSGQRARNVGETVQAKTLTELVISASNADSVAYWTARLVEMLKIKAFPNEEEVKELRFAVEKVLGQADEADSMTKLEESICAISSPNQTLVCVLLVEVLRKRQPGQAFAFERLMPTVTSIQHCAALLCGKEVSELKDEKWGALRGSMPRPFRLAAVRALAAMSTQRKMDMFKKVGLMKALMKSIHLRSILKDEIRRVNTRCEKEGTDETERVEGLKTLYLCQAILHKSKYPAGKKGWTAAAAQEWGELILPSLCHFCRDSLFEVAPQWAQVASDTSQRSIFQPQLASQPVPQPYRNDPSSLLARKGNTLEAWTRLLQLSRHGVFTSAQALMYLRVLLLLGYPCEQDGAKAGEQVSVDSLLRQGVDKGAVSWVQLLKAVKMVETVFNQDEVVKIVEIVRAKVEETMVLADGHGEHSTVRVSLGVESFKDKSGNTHQREKFRNVSAEFGPEVVDTYVAMLRGLLDTALTMPSVKTVCGSEPEEPEAEPQEQESMVVEEEASVASTAPRRAAVICCTPDLLNTTRTGLPPAIPSYSRSLLWRGEHACLQQVADEDERVQKLLVGITWKPPQMSAGQAVNAIVLDLSVICYDEDWGYVNQCSWEQLSVPGLKHSGDWYGQAMKTGSTARETVEIELEKLPPRVHYLVVTAFSYSGQDLNVLEDASIYLANPHQRGTGPGGMSVLSAQTLKGKGTVNISYCLELRDVGTPGATRKPTVVDAIAVDHTINVKTRSASSGHKEVGDDCKRVLHTKATQGLQLTTMASYLAASAAGVREVLLLHGDAAEGFAVDEQSDSDGEEQPGASELALIGQAVDGAVASLVDCTGLAPHNAAWFMQEALVKGLVLLPSSTTTSGETPTLVGIEAVANYYFDRSYLQPPAGWVPMTPCELKATIGGGPGATGSASVRRMVGGKSQCATTLLVRNEQEAAVDFATRVEQQLHSLSSCCKPDYSKICRGLGLDKIGREGSAGGSPVEEVLVFGGDYDDARAVEELTKGRASEHGWDGKLKVINLRSAEQKLEMKGEVAVVSGWDVRALLAADKPGADVAVAEGTSADATPTDDDRARGCKSRLPVDTEAEDGGM
jgi:hypothetical protein